LTHDSEADEADVTDWLRHCVDDIDSEGWGDRIVEERWGWMRLCKESNWREITSINHL
jgi:hypothetical protein